MAAGRAAPAALLLVLAIMLTLLTPFVIVGSRIAENAARVGDFFRAAIENGRPEPRRGDAQGAGWIGRGGVSPTSSAR